LKPENLLIDKDLSLKICDFEFGCPIFLENGSKREYSTAEISGSLESNPPELSNPLDFENYHANQVDIFGAAVVLFTMVMKSAPFMSTLESDIYYQYFKKKNK